MAGKGFNLVQSSGCASVWGGDLYTPGAPAHSVFAYSIEKKRTIVPTLADAIQQQDGREVDWEYFYSLLFTPANLKLVHIACHKKTTHKLECNPHRIYRRQPGPRRRKPARKRP